MKKVLLACAVALLSLPARTSQLAFIVLDVAGWGGGRLPSGWQIKVNHGKPDISSSTDGNEKAIRLKSVKSSFALERGMDVNLAEMPYLNWRWKVTELPSGGDFRRASTDDQAAQVLVAFADRRVLTYIWDSTAPKGTMESASSIPLVHIFAVVCESGTAAANRWIAETHNVAADYARAYGRPAPHVKGLRIQINSQHTGTTAESYFGDVAFRSMPPE
ncbi:MAG TPA: DUF3047 domain-containing protein [Bryobacteraceae bacterium]|nr:DUF3047 domain-containing protein [Bryobacteraceae bacterium]